MSRVLSLLSVQDEDFPFACSSVETFPQTPMLCDTSLCPDEDFPMCLSGTDPFLYDNSLTEDSVLPDLAGFQELISPSTQTCGSIF